MRYAVITRTRRTSPETDAGRKLTGRSTTVAIIVVNWNAGDWLRRVLASLSQQTFRDFSIVLVDNASTDDSINRVREYLSCVTFLPQPRNLGFAAANNLAVKEVDCEWVALLNPDAIPEPEWLERLMIAAAKNPGFSFFGSRQLMADAPHLLDGIGDAYHVSGIAWRQGYGQVVEGNRNLAEPVEIFSPCAAAGLYKRSAYLQVGGFDERYFCYFEDVDLGFRLRLTGHRALSIPDAVVHHGGSVTAGYLSAFGLYHGRRNLIWTFIKNMPADLLWRYLVLHILMNLFMIVRFTLRGQGQTIFRAEIDALRGLRSVLRSRKTIQDRRVISSKELLRTMHRGWPTRS